MSGAGWEEAEGERERKGGYERSEVRVAVLRDASRGEEGIGVLARTLEEQREALRAFEGTALAQVAESLARAAAELAEVQERQERSLLKNMVTEEDLACEMGYVNDDTGEVEKRQFVADTVRCGVERHKTSRTRTFYFRDEVEAAVRRLGE